MCCWLYEAMRSVPFGKIGFHDHLNSRRKVKLERDSSAEARLRRVAVPGAQQGRGLSADGLRARRSPAPVPSPAWRGRVPRSRWSPSGPLLRAASPLRQKAAQGCGSAPPLSLAPGQRPAAAEPPVTQRRPGAPLPRRRRLPRLCPLPLSR